MAINLNEQYINALSVMNSTASILSQEHFTSPNLDIHSGLNLVYKAHFIQNTTSAINNYNIAVVVKLIEESVKTIKIVNETISLSAGVSNQVKTVPTSVSVSTPKALPKPVPTLTTFTTILISRGLQVQIPTASTTGVTIIGNSQDDKGSQLVFQDKNSDIQSQWSIGPLLNSSNFYYDFVFTSNINGKSFTPLIIYEKDNIFSISSILSVSNDSVFSGDISIPTSTIVLGDENQATILNNSGINIFSTLTSSDFVIELNKTGQLVVYNNLLSQPALTVDNVSNNINVNKSINVTGSIALESISVHNTKGTQDYTISVSSTNALQFINDNNGITTYIDTDGTMYFPNNCHIANNLYVTNDIYEDGTINIQNNTPTISLQNTTTVPYNIWDIANEGNYLNLQFNGESIFSFNSDGSINNNIQPTEIASNLFASMPFQGTGYKKAILLFNGLETASTTQYTYNFATSFTYQPYIINKTVNIVLISLTTISITVQSNSGVTYNGILVIEGF